MAGAAGSSFLRIASLDTPSDFRPDAHIFHALEGSPWLSLEGGAPAFEIHYDMKTMWPAESLARRGGGRRSERQRRERQRAR